MFAAQSRHLAEATDNMRQTDFMLKCCRLPLKLKLMKCEFSKDTNAAPKISID